MLHLVTGNPGAKKSAFVVSKLNQIEINNKVNLVKNRERYTKNLPLIEKWKDDFTYYEYEVGTGHAIRQEIDILPDDYFAMFGLDEFPDDLRPDDYFLRSVRFNEICERINEREGIQGFQGLLPVRTIYANIKALKIDNIRPLEYDWRDCPDGSIIVIDEVQNVDPYDKEKDKHNPIIRDLTIHRHRGFDFYFITQYPNLLHPVAQVLIGVHYHLTVPWGWRTRVYQWGSIRTFPNTLVNKVNVERKFDFNPPASLFKMYKSTTINTHEKRLPWKPLILVSLFILACLVVLFMNLSSAKKSRLITNESVIASAPASTASARVPATASSVSSASSTASSVNSNFSAYDKEQQRLQQLAQIEQLQYERKLKTMPSNVIAFGNNCTAYNTDGLPLDMSLSDCKKYALGKKQTLKKMSNDVSLGGGNIAMQPSNENEIARNNDVLPK